MNADISKIKAEVRHRHTPGVEHPSKDASGRMSTQNIVLKALRNAGQQGSFKEIYAGIQQMLSTPRYRMMRAGNTLFLIEVLGDGAGKVKLINADAPQKVIKNISEFTQAIKKANYTTILFDSRDPLVTNALEQSGIPASEDNGRYVVDLGNL
jgi:hypothetical protein